MRLGVRGYHAAVAGGHDLAGMEGKTDKLAVPADRPAAVAATDGARRVFDHAQTALAGQRGEAVDVRRQAELMHQQDGFRAGAESRADVIEAEVEGVWIDFGEDWGGAGINH